jgi:hypothetical protein
MNLGSLVPLVATMVALLWLARSQGRPGAQPAG